MTDHLTLEDLVMLREKTETAQSLSDKQFDQSMDYAKILHREIEAEGKFKSKLDGLAYEFSISAIFGSYTANKILRDQYELRYGETPNDHLQRLLDNEQKLGTLDKQKAYEYALKSADHMEQQANPNFFRAFDRQAGNLAKSLTITEKKPGPSWPKATKNATSRITSRTTAKWKNTASESNAACPNNQWT